MVKITILKSNFDFFKGQKNVFLRQSFWIFWGGLNSRELKNSQKRKKIEFLNEKSKSTKLTVSRPILSA